MSSTQAEPIEQAKSRRIEIYKIQAMEYGVRYEAMRELEWKFILQVYAGYAAIAVSYNYLSGSRHSLLLIFVYVIGTIIFFGLTSYHSNRIEERLVKFSKCRDIYMQAMRWLNGTPALCNHDSLKHKHVWTYWTQTVLSLMTVLGLISYEVNTELSGNKWILAWRLGLLCTLLLLLATAITIALKFTHELLRPIDLVWYVSYGSNLKEERFMCYIKGGKPEGAKQRNPGSNDKSPPSYSEGMLIKAKLYFAEKSESWGNSGVAFIDPESKDGETLGKAYLITFEQFRDVVQQENGAKPGTAGFPTLLELTQDHHTDYCVGYRRYTRLLYLGDKRGYPAFTFTGPREHSSLAARTAPSEEYVRAMAEGMMETFPNLTAEEISDYFAERTKNDGNSSRERFLAWVKGVAPMTNYGGC
jgi:hypothetical protein